MGEKEEKKTEERQIEGAREEKTEGGKTGTA